MVFYINQVGTNQSKREETRFIRSFRRFKSHEDF